MRLNRSIILLVTILVSYVFLQDAAAEPFKKGLHRIVHQTHVNIYHAGKHIEQETHNFFRMIFEDRCDEVRRNQGPEAGQQCEADAKAKGIGPQGPPPQGNEKYLAAAEVDCFKPGYDGRWSNEDIYVWSSKSKEDARQAIQTEIESNRVCETRGHDRNLTDGESRWIRIIGAFFGQDAFLRTPLWRARSLHLQLRADAGRNFRKRV